MPRPYLIRDTLEHIVLIVLAIALFTVIPALDAIFPSLGG